jgi:hypothetical protein
MVMGFSLWFGLSRKMSRQRKVNREARWRALLFGPVSGARPDAENALLRSLDKPSCGISKRIDLSDLID